MSDFRSQPSTYSMIIAGRPYKSIDDLLAVKGIGKKTLEKLRPFMHIPPVIAPKK